jgi:hypothetical protein
LAEIRRQQADGSVKSESELETLISQAQLAEASGRYGAARVRYRQAAEKAVGAMREQLLAKYESLADK